LVRSGPGAVPYLETLALSSAGLPTDTTLYEAADVDQRTADAYDRLLSSLFLLDLVPAWASNRIVRLFKRSERSRADRAVAMAAARIDQGSVLSDPDLLGRLLDTFVTAQLRPELDLLRPRARTHHLRTEAGRQESTAPAASSSAPGHNRSSSTTGSGPCRSPPCGRDTTPCCPE
jgi:predicted AAA+ superfamily ATPase